MLALQNRRAQQRRPQPGLHVGLVDRAPRTNLETPDVCPHRWVDDPDRRAASALKARQHAQCINVGEQVIAVWRDANRAIRSQDAHRLARARTAQQIALVFGRNRHTE